MDKKNGLIINRKQYQYNFKQNRVGNWNMQRIRKFINTVIGGVATAFQKFEIKCQF